MEKGIPQGLKPGFGEWAERPKAEALGYLEATASAPWRRAGGASHGF